MLLEFVLHSSGAVLQPTVPGCLMLKASFSTIWSLNGLFPRWIFQFPACHVQTFSHWTTVLHQFQEPVRNSRKTTIMCENVAFLVFCYLFKTHGMPTGLSYFRTDCRLSIKLVTQFSEALSLIYQHLLLWKKDFCLIRFSKAWLELHFFPPTKINTDHHGPSRKKKRVVSIGPRLMVLDFFGHRKWIASI